MNLRGKMGDLKKKKKITSRNFFWQLFFILLHRKQSAIKSRFSTSFYLNFDSIKCEGVFKCFFVNYQK